MRSAAASSDNNRVKRTPSKAVAAAGTRHALSSSRTPASRAAASSPTYTTLEQATAVPKPNGAVSTFVISPSRCSASAQTRRPPLRICQLSWIDPVSNCSPMAVLPSTSVSVASRRAVGGHVGAKLPAHASSFKHDRLLSEPFRPAFGGDAHPHLDHRFGLCRQRTIELLGCLGRHGRLRPLSDLDRH